MMQTDERVSFPREDLSGTVVRQPHQRSARLKAANDLSPIDRTTCTENSTPPLGFDHLYHYYLCMA